MPSSMRTSWSLSEKEKHTIVSAYKNGDSLFVLCNRYQLAKSTIWNLLNRRGVKCRGTVRKHKVDDTAFSYLRLNRQSAYWIGFIMADGCVNEKRNRLTVALASRDSEHLLKLRDFLKADYKIYDTVQHNKHRATLTIVSNKIVKDLAIYGVVPRKSLIAKVKLLEWDSDFWRGAVDGDGHICISTKRSNFPRIGLSGSLKLVQQFREFCILNCPDASKTNISDSGNIFQYVISGKQAKQIAILLYRDCCVSLDRKMSRAHRAMSYNNV